MKVNGIVLGGLLAVLLVASCSAPPPGSRAQKKAEPAPASEPEPAVVEAPPEPAAREMYINVDVANVRREPSRSAAIAGKLRLGDEIITIGAPAGEWQSVQFGGADASAWIHTSLLSPSYAEALQTREAARSGGSAPAAVTPPTPPPGEAMIGKSFGEEPIEEGDPAPPAGPIAIGTPADTVLAIRGAADDEKIIGSDENGSIVEWTYRDAVYVMKRWAIDGVTCYRVAEIR